LLASKTEQKRKEMLPRSDLTATPINDKNYYILHEQDLKAGISAFVQATTGSEVGSQALTFKRSGDTEGDLIVHTTLTREPHPDCKPHDHLQGMRTQLKVADVASVIGSISDDTAPEEVKKSAAAAAMFGPMVAVKDTVGRSKGKAAPGAATIVAGGFDAVTSEAAVPTGGDEEDVVEAV